MQEQQRDQRIDLLRGLALLIICVDHIQHNRLAEFTPRAVGYSDMAEVFVFLSGMVSAWSFERRSQNHQHWNASLLFAQRSALLYLSYIVAGTGMLLLVRWAAAGHLLTSHQVGALSWPLWKLFVEVATLRQHVPHLTILPLYTLCLLVLPVLLMVTQRLSPTLRRFSLSAFAMMLYLSAQQDWLVLPEPYRTALYYHPCGWGAVFLTGAILGIQPRAASRWWANSALAWTAIIVLLLLISVSESQLSLRHGLKVVPGPLRLLHFCCCAVLVVQLLPANASWYPGWILQCGRTSLPVYVGGAYLSVGLSLLLAPHANSIGWQIAVNVLAIIGCMLVSRVAMWQRDCWQAKSA